MVYAGRIRSALAAQPGSINAANLHRAHARLEGNAVTGKVLLAGFDD